MTVYIPRPSSSIGARLAMRSLVRDSLQREARVLVPPTENFYY